MKKRFTKEKILTIIIFFHFSFIIIYNCHLLLVKNSTQTKSLLNSIIDAKSLKTIDSLFSTYIYSDTLHRLQDESAAFYLNISGLETGYGFFSPRVSSSYKLVFEIEFQDGTKEIGLPIVQEREIGLRFANFYDGIAATKYEPLKDILVKRFVQNQLKYYPMAIKIKAIFGYIYTPSMEEYRNLPELKYEPVFSYDYSL